MTTATTAEAQTLSLPPSRNRVFHFLIELRRRRVCRAITMYSVALWLVCQIVDVISLPLGLPDWTLKLVIVLGLLGLPIIIILSWLFEITPEGLQIEGPTDTPLDRSKSSGRKHVSDRLIDSSLILAALAIGVQLAVGAIDDGITPDESVPYKIAVTPFLATDDEGAASLSGRLAIELQHSLRQQAGITVVASSDPAQLKGSVSLTGVVSANETVFRVTLTMIDFETGEVIWSTVFNQPRTESYALSSELAHHIVNALPLRNEGAAPARLANVTQ